jgi:cytidylate kinase
MEISLALLPRGHPKGKLMPFTVAIDGPAAAGKGTIGRALAQEFGFAHLDTGLLYRAVGMKGGDPVQAAQSLSPDDLAWPDLRSLAAGEAASRVAAIPQVRAALVAFQRDFARRAEGAVLDGRDIGTVICPEADVKLFVTASAECRAARRFAETGEGTLADVLEQVRVRDARDMGRADAPLRPAPDAITLDTTNLEISEAIGQARAIVAARLGQ